MSADKPSPPPERMTDEEFEKRFDSDKFYHAYHMATDLIDEARRAREAEDAKDAEIAAKYAAFREQFARADKAEAERDEFREALAKILNTTNHHDGALEIAQAALAGEKP